MINTSDYLLLSAALFSIGVYGLMTKRNAIRLLFSVEMILNGANINLVAFSTISTVSGQIIPLFAIAIAASEAAIGLAIIFEAFRVQGTVDVRKLTRLRG